jgi:hypothetical protein
LAGPAAVRGGPRCGRRVRRRRVTGQGTGRLADRVLGPGDRGAGDAGPGRTGRRAATAGCDAGTVGGVRLPRGRQHVSGLLRLVPRPGHRADDPAEPGSIGPTATHPRLGRPATARTADQVDGARRRRTHRETATGCPRPTPEMPPNP